MEWCGYLHGSFSGGCLYGCFVISFLMIDSCWYGFIICTVVVCHILHDACHILLVINVIFVCHILHVIYHTPYVICHTSYVACAYRVCMVRPKSSLPSPQRLLIQRPSLVHPPLLFREQGQVVHRAEGVCGRRA